MSPEDPLLKEQEEEVEKCPDCDTELEVDEANNVYCPNDTCPRFMIDVEEEELDAAGLLDDDEEEDDD